MHGPKTASVQKEFPLKDSKAAAFLKTGSKREYERRIISTESAWVRANIQTNIFALKSEYFLGNITSREGTPDYFPDRGEMCSDMQKRIEDLQF